MNFKLGLTEIWYNILGSLKNHVLDSVIWPLNSQPRYVTIALKEISNFDNLMKIFEILHTC